MEFMVMTFFLIASAFCSKDYTLCTKYFTLKCVDGADQSITDDPELGNHFTYGTYGVDTFCDHSNQVFKQLKNVEIGDDLYIAYDKTIKHLKCEKICTMKLDSMGHIRDEDGNYMGDADAPCTILYTCKSRNRRLVTIWREVDE